MRDHNIGRLLLTLQLILLWQIIWKLKKCHAEADPAFSLRVADFARGTLKNRFNSICDHPFHSWMCSNSQGKSLSDSQRFNTAENKLGQVSFRTPKSVTPSTLVVTLPPRYLARTEAPKSLSKSANLNSLPTQVLPTKYSYEVDPNYDMCSHPFHAWLCDKSTQGNESEYLLTATESRDQPPESVLIATVEPPITQLNIEIEKHASFPHGSVDFSNCNHSFHSWMCDNNIKHESKLSQNIISTKNIQKIHKMILPEKHINVVQSNNKSCNPVFHSWLCRSSFTVPIAPQRAKSLPSDIPSNKVTQFSQPRNVPNKIKISLMSTNHNCNHSFTSWLCPQMSHKEPVKSFRTTTFTSKLSKSLVSKSSVNIIPSILTSRESETKTFAVATADVNKCNHAFHSWLCPKSSQPTQIKTFSTIKASNESRNLIAKKLNIVTSALPHKFPSHNQSLPKTSHLCSHAFHSWLCPQPVPKEQNIPLTTTSSPKRGKNLLPNLTPRPQPSISKESHTCNHAFHSWLCATPYKLQTTTKSSTPITTSLRPQSKNLISKSLINVVTQAPSPMQSTLKVNQSIKNDYHKCNHAFHSWLCATPKRITTTSAPKLEKLLIHQPSMNTLVTPSTSSRSVSGSYEKCNHAFHSWLCQKPSKMRKINLSARKLDNEQRQTKQASFVSLQKSFNDSFPVRKEFDCTNSDAVHHPLFSTRCKIEQTLSSTTSSSSTKKILTTTEMIALPGKNVFNIPTVTAPSLKMFPANSWEGSNPCTHAFHAWLCQPLRPKLTQPPFSPPRHSPNFILDNLTKSSKSLISSIRPVTVAPEVKLGQGFSSFPLNVNNHEKKKDNDKCSHSFHSFLCNKIHPKTTSVDEPTTEFVLEKSLLESRSSDIQTVSKIGDPCNHPFHSWHCFTFDNKKSTLSLDQIPNVMSLPLENEKTKFEDPTRNTRKIKITDQNLLINNYYLNDAFAETPENYSRSKNDQGLHLEEKVVSRHETPPITTSEIFYESEPINNLGSELDPPSQIREDVSTIKPQSHYRTTKAPLKKIRSLFNRSPGTPQRKENANTFSKSNNVAESLSQSGSLSDFTNLPDYDWSGTLLFESKRTIPRKINI